jgi:hypothetical protein
VGARGKGKLLLVASLALIVLSGFKILAMSELHFSKGYKGAGIQSVVILCSMLVEVFGRVDDWERARKVGSLYSQVLMVSISVMHRKRRVSGLT